MATLDMVSFEASLKQLYSDDKIQNMTYQDNPLWAMLPKMDSFKGKNYVIDLIYGNNQGTSADFVTAQANKTAGRIKSFTITRKKEYGVASIDNETIEASEGNSAAFVDAYSFALDGTIHQVARNMAIAIYGSGTGKIGQVSAINGLVLTLNQVEDITNFEVDMKLNFSTANGGGTVKANEPLVTALDRDLGTVTVSDVTGVAVNDYMFRDGDYDNKLSGLQAWLPSSVTNTPFFGMDRSVDKTRLAGIQISGSNKPIEEALVEGASRIAREGGKPTHAFMSYAKYADLEKSMGTRLQYTQADVTKEIGFRGILVNGPRGVIRVFPDQNCPANKCFLLQLDTWKVYSLGKAPRILNMDGLNKLRESNADAIELRVGAYLQLGCTAPGYNGVINF